MLVPRMPPPTTTISAEGLDGRFRSTWGMRSRPAGLLAYNLKDEGSGSGSVVEIDENELLPSPQQEPPLLEWYGKARLQQRRPDVTESVAVSPAHVVLIGE